MEIYYICTGVEREVYWGSGWGEGDGNGDGDDNDVVVDNGVDFLICFTRAANELVIIGSCLYIIKVHNDELS